MPVLDFATRSIARRLFFTAAALSFLLLLLASVFLTQYYRRNAEEMFERRLDVYLRAIVADVSQPGEEGRGPGQLGEPQFELPNSGWYWQITRTDDEEHEIMASRSLFAAQLPKLADLGVMAETGGARRGTAPGPDGRRLRIVERVIDVGDIGRLSGAGRRQRRRGRARHRPFSLRPHHRLRAARHRARHRRRVPGALRSAPVALVAERARRDPARRARTHLGRYPIEVAPLADELNLLIGANRDIVERARTQVGNLAHALKTPLSVIVNEADAAPSPLAEKVSEQAAVMRDQITFYLDRARAAARAGAIGSTTRVEPVVAALLRTFAKICAERGVTFTGEAATELCFSASARISRR